MKKIAFVLKFFQKEKFHGGGEKLFYKLIDKLIADGYFIDVYCSKTDIKEHTGINKIVEISTPYNHLKPIMLEDFYDEVKSKIKDSSYGQAYDYIISENITPPLDITFIQGHSMLHRQKTVKTPFEALFYPFRKVKRERIKYQQKWMKKGYRKIFVPSQKAKSDIVQNFNINPDKIAVVYPGVEINADIYRKHSSKNEKFTFGLSAPGFEKKGGYIFLKALKILKNKGFDVEAKIIYPKYKTNLFIKIFLKVSGLEKQVKFLGFQKEMKDFYSSIDCMVMPSKEDSFGMVTLESMSYYKPVIVSSNAGASEIVTDGENGFVFNMQRAEQNLADKMIYVLKNQNNLDNLAAKAYNTAKEYSWEKVYKDFISNLP